MGVPLFDTRTPLEPLQAELLQALTEAAQSGRYILGPCVEAFEREFAAYLAVRHAVGVASGTDALTIALRALGVGDGDEVIVPSFTFYATAEAVAPTGARPVFCDIEPETFCVSADTVRAALTARTKAVIAVHLFGNIAPVKEIEALGLPVVEDAAQAAGSVGVDGKAGALGQLAAFSFFPSKNLPCFGDGGAVTTNDPVLAERVQILRYHGSRDKKLHVELGYNSRLDELQAAVLRVMLPHLEEWAQRRWQVGRWYADSGIGRFVELPVAPPGARAAWHLFVIRSSRAEQLARFLNEQGHGCRGYYRTPIHRQPGMARYAPFPPLPATEAVAQTNLALPIAPTLSRRQVELVATALSRFFDR